MIKGFDEAVKKIKYDIEYGFHVEDLTPSELEDDICFIFDKLANQRYPDTPDLDVNDFSKL